jgi:hypothetical protein
MITFAMPGKAVFKLNLVGSEAPGKKKSYCAIMIGLLTELEAIQVGQSNAPNRYRISQEPMVSLLP